ncbi:uncharacterized protein LOC144005490 [Festucalex cinctus]
MDGQGDGWHNGPNSIRLPLLRGVRRPNGEPNMEFIAILDFIVNQDVIFVNGPEQWDLDGNNLNNNPIHVNNVNMEDNNNPPHDAAVGAEAQMEVNQRVEAVEQSREHSTNDDDDEDEIRSSEHIRKSSPLDNTSDRNTDLDEASREPQPGPSWQRSEDDDEDEDGTRRNRQFPWWYEFHQKSSDSSPDFDFYKVNPLLCGSNQSLDSQDENGEMEPKPRGEFSPIASCAGDLAQSIIDSDPARDVSDCEERFKDFSEQETEHEPVEEQFKKSSKGKVRHQTERGSSKRCQRCHGCDENISEKTTDQDDPEENSLACGPNKGSRESSEETTQEPRNDSSEMPNCERGHCIRSSSTPEKGGVSSDEDPQPRPSNRISGNEIEMIDTKHLRWWHEYCANISDSSTDLEDSEGVPTSRKRSVDDNGEQ